MFKIALISEESGNVFYLNQGEVTFNKITNIEDSDEILIGLKSRLIRLQNDLEMDIETHTVQTYIVDYVVTLISGHKISTKGFLVKATSSREAFKSISDMLLRTYTHNIADKGIDVNIKEPLNV